MKVDLVYNQDTFEMDVLEKIVKPCRKGNFFYIRCENKSLRVKMVKELKKHLSYKRGLFTYKGIVIVAVDFFENWQLQVLGVEKLFDEIIEFKRESKNGRKN